MNDNTYQFVIMYFSVLFERKIMVMALDSDLLGLAQGRSAMQLLFSVLEKISFLKDKLCQTMEHISEGGSISGME